MRALLAGWFSFEGMGATAGDLMVRDVVTGWLTEAGVAFDVALVPALGEGVRIETVDPAGYSDLIFACGPLGNGAPVTSLLARFAHARKTAIDVSMLQDIPEWNPFDLLLERDSSAACRPDVAFLAQTQRVPVTGLILAHEQKEYAGRRHDEVHHRLRTFLAGRAAAVVPIDTCLDPANVTGLGSAAEIETLIARMDVIVTTRLHGLVLGLKNGVPVVAIDPVAGGAKIRAQAEVLGWPFVFLPDELNEDLLSSTFDKCLSDEHRAETKRIARFARQALASSHRQFIDFFSRAQVRSGRSPN